MCVPVADRPSAPAASVQTGSSAEDKQHRGGRGATGRVLRVGEEEEEEEGSAGRCSAWQELSQETLIRPTHNFWISESNSAETLQEVDSWISLFESGLEAFCSLISWICVGLMSAAESFQGLKRCSLQWQTIKDCNYLNKRHLATNQ